MMWENFIVRSLQVQMLFFLQTMTISFYWYYADKNTMYIPTSLLSFLFLEIHGYKVAKL